MNAVRPVVLIALVLFAAASTFCTRPEPACVRRIICHRGSCDGPVSYQGCDECPDDEFDHDLCEAGYKTLPQPPMNHYLIPLPELEPVTGTQGTASASGP